MPGGRSVYIAGAGIAGLTLSLALAKFGARVAILERQKTVQEIGAGLQISPNARRVLNRLGLDKAISAVSFEPEGIDVYGFRAARPMVTMELGEAARSRYGAQYAVMHRADLADVLHKATRRFANIDIAFETLSFEVETQARGVIVAHAQAGAEPRQGRAFAFVGADGINSMTRTVLLGGSTPEWTGRLAWRVLLEMSELKGLLNLNRTSVLLGPNFHAVCYPLPHRNKVNVVVFAKDRLETERVAPALPGGALDDERIAAIVTAGAGRWGYWPVGSVHTDHWHKGPIGLLGDAAHAMMPFQAQGAAMAIEDAAILAPLLMTEPSAEIAFERYEGLRRYRVDQVANLSAANGRAFHMRFPASLARDAVIRMQGPRGHFRRLDWLYGYDPAPEAEIGAPTRTN
ncbi:FAD-dependent monooxygenase [Paradevosia shaoguanensis]|uniref:FAD-dependent monooxygenase n=1 Tax=Paradevosia shaoguanensis TaxID=1335043 RepID=UPI001931A9C0|nr:FAD-dependent monooxygenase [Paradevosia shaoguanensis]